MVNLLLEERAIPLISLYYFHIEASKSPLESLIVFTHQASTARKSAQHLISFRPWNVNVAPPFSPLLHPIGNLKPPQ